jgi:hypothetical protein
VLCRLFTQGTDLVGISEDTHNLVVLLDCLHYVVSSSENMLSIDKTHSNELLGK